MQMFGFGCLFMSKSIFFAHVFDSEKFAEKNPIQFFDREL